MITSWRKGLIMSLSKTKIYTLFILSVFLLSSCEVYETLYGELPSDEDLASNEVLLGNDEDLVKESEPEEDLVAEDQMEEDPQDEEDFSVIIVTL